MNQAAKATPSFEDPLTYLPRRPLHEFPKRQIIYDPHRPADQLYLVITGRIKIASASDDGAAEVVARIVCAEGLFGEEALIGGMCRSQSAVALDNVTVMAWSPDEIEAQIEREPRLGLALSQHVVRRCIELQDRIESMAVYRTPERVMLALVQLADALGTPVGDGSVRIASLTHHTIAEYVGTSREIVTSQLNRLRHLGLLCYSRKQIDIYAQGIRDVLREQGIGPRRIQTGLMQAGR